MESTVTTVVTVIFSASWTRGSSALKMDRIVDKDAVDPSIH